MTLTEAAGSLARSQTTAAAPPVRRRHRGLRGDHSSAPWEIRALSPLLIIVIWQLASSTGLLPTQVLASPAAIVGKFTELVSDGTLGGALTVSLGRAAAGFALGVLIALLAGIPVGLSRTGEAIIDPLMQMVRTIPLLGLVPLFIIWFGIGEGSKILLVALGVAVPLYLNLIAALRDIDPGLYDIADSLRLTRRQRIRHILMPGALPGVLVGLRQSLGFAWLALIVAEQISASSGLGFMINNARDFLQTETIVIGLLTYAALGLITDGLVRSLERRALAWRATGTD